MICDDCGNKMVVEREYPAYEPLPDKKIRFVVIYKCTNCDSSKGVVEYR
jgi:transposase-like protein